MLEKMNRCYPAWLNLLPLLVMLISIWYLLWSYDQLPPRIATHFNFAGLPDGFGDKGSIIFLPIINVIITVAMTIINILVIMRPDNPRQVFNLSSNQLEAIGEAKLEQMRVFMARSLYIITLLVTVMLSYGVGGEVRVALGQQKGLGSWMVVLAGALLIVCFYMAIKAVGWSFTPTKK